MTRHTDNQMRLCYGIIFRIYYVQVHWHTTRSIMVEQKTSSNNLASESILCSNIIKCQTTTWIIKQKIKKFYGRSHSTIICKLFKKLKEMKSKLYIRKSNRRHSLSLINYVHKFYLLMNIEQPPCKKFIHNFH